MSVLVPPNTPLEGHAYDTRIQHPFKKGQLVL